jgi:hypothetical protein
MLSGLGIVRIEVEVQEVLQVAKKMLDVDTTAEGTEARQIRFATGTEFVRSLHLITVHCKNEKIKINGTRG